MTKDFDFKHYYCEYGKYEMKELTEATKKNLAKLWLRIICIYNYNYNMGNEQKPETGNEVYLSEIQHRSPQDLMYQSKLSCSNFDTKLSKKIFKFGSGSDYVASYIQKYSCYEWGWSFLDSISSVTIWCCLFIATSGNRRATARIRKSLKYFSFLRRFIMRSTASTLKMRLQHARSSLRNFLRLRYNLEDEGLVSFVCLGQCLPQVLALQNKIGKSQNQPHPPQ